MMRIVFVSMKSDRSDTGSRATGSLFTIAPRRERRKHAAAGCRRPAGKNDGARLTFDLREQAAGPQRLVSAAPYGPFPRQGSSHLPLVRLHSSAGAGRVLILFFSSRNKLKYPPARRQPRAGPAPAPARGAARRATGRGQGGWSQPAGREEPLLHLPAPLGDHALRGLPRGTGPRGSATWAAGRNPTVENK